MLKYKNFEKFDKVDKYLLILFIKKHEDREQKIFSLKYTFLKIIILYQIINL